MVNQYLNGKPSLNVSGVWYRSNLPKGVRLLGQTEQKLGYPMIVVESAAFLQQVAASMGRTRLNFWL
jgi:hypothetical protein